MANVYDHNYFQELREIVEYADCEKVTESIADQYSSDVFDLGTSWAVVGYNTYDDKVVLDYAESREDAVRLCKLMVAEGEAHKAKIEAEYEIDLSPYSTLVYARMADQQQITHH